MGIPNDVIEDVTVTSAQNTGTFDHIFTLSYIKNSGNIATLSVSATDGTGNTGTMTASVTATDGNTELSTCSNRGICDFDSGLCKCFKGFYGDDCSVQNALAGGSSASV